MHVATDSELQTAVDKSLDRGGYSGCLLHRGSGPARQGRGGKSIRCDFPLLREVQQTTRVPAPLSRPLSTAVSTSL
ncbi:hypothetical protein Y032_0134g1813 [Ancylostoma ceylanicum]|uniref:Uncharacterized protein n=1 Tax=Ancylostoma ceylanicum TaxID=53326 RepID=A0A016T4Y2_9BILA|nr:hypothetical protein Y032_0134g1813 [Ancylostoma ceylanicum]